jgi:hypothetical protein
MPVISLGKVSIVADDLHLVFQQDAEAFVDGLAHMLGEG